MSEETAPAPAPPPPRRPRALRLRPVFPLERDVEAAVCTYAKGLGFYVRKFVSPAHRSVPDRLFISPAGVLFFIEFKRQGKRATPAQLIEHVEIEKYGPRVHVVDEARQGKAVIDSYF